MSDVNEWPEFEKHSGIYHRHDDEIIELNKEQYNHARLCVNACAGLPDETLSLDVIERLTSLNTMQSEMERLVEHNAALEQQRGELVALLKIAGCPNCDGSGAFYSNMGDVCQCQFCDELTKALAKAGAQGKGI